MGVGGWGRGGRNDDDEDDDNDGGAAVPTRREALNTHEKCIFAHLIQEELLIRAGHASGQSGSNRTDTRFP